MLQVMNEFQMQSLSDFNNVEPSWCRSVVLEMLDSTYTQTHLTRQAAGSQVGAPLRRTPTPTPTPTPLRRCIYSGLAPQHLGTFLNISNTIEGSHDSDVQRALGLGGGGAQGCITSDQLGQNMSVCELRVKGQNVRV